MVRVSEGTEKIEGGTDIQMDLRFRAFLIPTEKSYLRPGDANQRPRMRKLEILDSV